MKLQTSGLVSCFAFAAMLIPSNAKNTAPAPSSNTTSPSEPCGNPEPSGTPYCKICIDGADYFIPDVGSSCDTNSIRSYNGNAHREITDLEISGSVGKMPLTFTRYSNTRLSSRNLAHSAFGIESSWSHNYEWVVRDNGGTVDRPIIKITYPKGDEMRFQRWSATSNTWIPTNSRNPDRIVSSGDDFVLHTRNREKYGFKRRIHSVTGGVFYRLQSITDPAANTQSVAYLNGDDTLIRQVTDPAGNWIKLHYNDLSVRSNGSVVLSEQLLPSGSTGVWKEVNLTPGAAYRILALYQGNTWRQKTPLRVAELEFYDENNVKITGTAFGSWPWAANSEPFKATDGNVNTHYQYAYEKAGHVGIDLGAGNAKQVSRIRYRLSGSLESDASVTFVGMNNEPVANHVISHVEGSDGREVGYDYNVYTEPSGLFQWVQLTAANYPDLTSSLYNYKWQHRHVMPVLEKANDPRYEGSVKQVRYGFDLNTVVGFVSDEYDNASGQLIASVRWDGGHIPKLVYPNGRVNRFEYTDGNLMRSIDSFGAVTDYTYTWNGYVLTEDDPLGRTTTYTRNAEGRILSVTKPSGSVTTYTRDAAHYITAVNRNRRITGYILDPVTKLRTRANHPDGTYETWSYNSYGQPLSHRQRNGHSEYWTYDSAGLKKSHTDAAGAVTLYHHYGDPGIPTDRGPVITNVVGRLAYIVDAHGNTTNYRYNDRGQITREIRTPGNNISLAGQPVQNTANDFTVTTENTYDDYGNLIARAVNTNDPNTPGRLWLYEYDSLNRLTREEDPLNRVTLTRYNHGAGGCTSCGGASAHPFEVEHPDGTITRYTYDKEWRVLSVTHAFGTPIAAKTTYTYDLAGQRITMEDPMGHITRWEYDADGRVTKETRAHGTPIASATNHKYDIHGNRYETTDPVGAITRTTFDVMDRPLTITRAWSTPIALTTTYTYALGRLTSVKDNINRTVTFTHDNLDRNIRTDFPDGNYTQSFFDMLGRNYKNRDILGNHPSRLFNSRGQTLASTDAAGVTTSALYNGHGDLTETSLPSGKSVKYVHDIAGNVIKTILAPGTAEETTVSEILTRDAMLRPLTVKDGEGKIMTMTYDLLGRTLTAKDALNNITTYTYDLDGQLLTTKAADNVVTSTRTYDALHRLKTDRDGKNQTITYNYDAAGQMTSYIDAKGATFSFQYDLLSRQTRRTEPDATFRTWTYDTAGRMEYHTKADGVIIRHHYENPDRDELSRTTYNGGTPDRSYTYTTFGQPLTAANAHSTITFGYDAAGRKTSESQALQGLPGTHTFSYQYDTDGQLTRHIRPDGSYIDYAYNLRNLLGAVSSDGPPPVASYTYNGRNQLEGAAIENGLFTATRAYDDAGRLTGVTNGALDTTAYTLSPDGRRTGISRNGQSETYGYDNARQVAGSSIPLTGGTHENGYQYDAAANRSSATTNGVTTSYFANAVNEYTSVGSFNPSHDPNGNLLTGQVPGSAGLQPASFTWNIHNEMVTATAANGDTAQYQYDALGRRTKRTETIGGVPISTWFLTNGWNVELEYEYGAYARRMTWGQDLSQTLQGAGGVGGLVMSEELPSGGGAPVPHFPTYDGNGNITAWVNASGTVIARLRYDAFGNIIEQTGTPPSRYGFSTKPIELVTGFLYYGYRFYDPVTGRWPSRDPIGENGGLNLYGFVGNDGVNKWDLLGLEWRCWNTGVHSLRQILHDEFQFKFQCVCEQRCCSKIGRRRKGVKEWDHEYIAWTSEKFDFYTYEREKEGWRQLSAAAANAENNLTSANDSGPFPVIPSRPGYSGQTLDQQLKEREEWRKKNNAVWDYMKEKCANSCPKGTGPYLYN
jgi:RHS repeat-associated protein